MNDRPRVGVVIAIGVVVAMAFAYCVAPGAWVDTTAAEARRDKGIRCAIDWRRGPKAVGRLVHCAAESFKGVPGDGAFAVRVASCESGLRPDANENPPYVGVMQHDAGAWPERARRYGFPGASPFNARANIFAGVLMARDAGDWGAWPECSRRAAAG